MIFNLPHKYGQQRNYHNLENNNTDFIYTGGNSEMLKAQQNIADLSIQLQKARQALERLLSEHDQDAKDYDESWG